MARLEPGSFLREPDGEEARDLLARSVEVFAAGDAEGALALHERLLAEHAPKLSKHDALALESERARYLLALGEKPRAIDALVAAGEEAERREHVALAAALFASVGAIYGGVHDFGTSARAYARAARCADRAEDLRLTVGCLRAQGHAALNLGDPAQALDAWSAALGRLRRAIPRTPEAPLPLRVVEVALALAAALQQIGDEVGAAALRGHADAISSNFRRAAPKGSRRHEN
jgi:tetratricopeptide (TPR) repeat protein